MSLIKQNYKTTSQLPRNADLCVSGQQPGFGLPAWLQPRTPGGDGGNSSQNKPEWRGCAGATRTPAAPRAVALHTCRETFTVPLLKNTVFQPPNQLPHPTFGCELGKAACKSAASSGLVPQPRWCIWVLVNTSRSWAPSGWALSAAPEGSEAGQQPRCLLPPLCASLWRQIGFPRVPSHTSALLCKSELPPL